MTEIDDAITALRKHASLVKNRIYDCEAQIAAWRVEQASVEGQITGLENAKTLFFSDPAEPAPPGTRHAVQRVVMALFERANGASLSEAEIHADIDLPADAIHKFLLRAVREKKLVVDGSRYVKPMAERAAAE